MFPGFGYIGNPMYGYGFNAGNIPLHQHAMQSQVRYCFAFMCKVNPTFDLIVF